MLTDLLAQGEISRLMNAVAAGTTDQTSSAADLEGCEGALFLVPFGTITAGALTSIKLQGSTDDGSTDAYADLAGTAVVVADTQSNKVAAIFIQRPLKKYAKLIVDRGTQNAVIDGVFVIKLGMKKVPVTQGSTVVATSKTVISPAPGTA